jgi:ketosteroid isomerase-like protein
MLADHFRAIGTDAARASTAYADDAVLEYVQSGERIAGRANISASRQAYPGRPSALEVVRVIGAGDVWVAELVLRIDGADPHPVAAVVELRDGLIVRERIYIAEPWDPPAYRAQWAETIESIT